MKKITTSQAVDFWKEHSDNAKIDQAIIKVDAGDKLDTFFIRGDEVAFEKDAPRFDFLASGQWNGLCWCCGEIFTGTVISRLGHLDPVADQVIPREELETMSIMINDELTYYAATYAATHACPTCATIHHLRPGLLSKVGIISHKSMTSIETRDHPEYSKYKDNPQVLVELGIRAVRRGLNNTIHVYEQHRDKPKKIIYGINIWEVLDE